MGQQELHLFATSENVPEGLRYRRDFVTADEEQMLARLIHMQPLKEFEFQGFLGRRRVISFGWQYVFDGSGLKWADPIPDFLLPLRDRVALFAGIKPDDFQHVLLTEYAPGAGIGWHRDRSVFGDVVGISLLAPATLRFRRKDGRKWDRKYLIVEPRSAYLLTGPARTDWEHSILPMDRLRYSITFRTVKDAERHVEASRY